MNERRDCRAPATASRGERTTTRRREAPAGSAEIVAHEYSSPSPTLVATPNAPASWRSLLTNPTPSIIMTGGFTQRVADRS